ncbi:BRO-N domain-containing protein [Paenibacillus lautus]
MNKPSIFNNPLFGQIRAIEVEGKSHFVDVDVARALMYSNPSKAVIDHCKGVSKLGIPSEGGVIPEGDVYRLIVKAADQSRNPEIKEKAEQFESWIFDEVLPKIRRTGGHVSDDDRLDYIDKVPELYEISCKIYENDVKELVSELYELNTAN